jgi:hypothetical protein
MPRTSGRTSKPTPKGIKYRQEVEIKNTKAKTRRNTRLREGELQALPIPKGFHVEDADDFDMGKLSDKFGTMKLGARRRKNRKTRRSRN